jgi:TIR domain
MPLPILQRTAEESAPEGANCRVFVSFSHKDMKLAERFITFLSVKVRTLPQLLIREQQIFFDRQRLRAGDEWDEAIQQALEEAHYFVFLISIDSLSSRFCLSRELKIAASRRIPIFPILLQDCPWEDLPIEGDPANRTLGAFAALPKNDNFDLCAIGSWRGKRDEALNRTVEQLSNAFLTYKAPAVVQPLTQSDGHRAPALLPYFCNQIDIVNQFNRRIQAWDNSALLVMSRGHYNDNLPRFWDRLREKNLKDYLSLRKSQLLEPRPLILPVPRAWTGDKEHLTSSMMSALSESLTGNAFELRDPVALSSYLTGLRGVVPLVASLPSASLQALAASLRSLIDLLEHSPLGAHLERLAIAIFLEQRSLISIGDLCRALKLSGYGRTSVVDLEPLQQIDAGDVRRWFRDHAIDRLSGTSEEDLVQKVFGFKQNSRRLRLGQFDMRVRPFLGL